jgi:hypothetical protein
MDSHGPNAAYKALILCGFLGRKKRRSRGLHGLDGGEGGIRTRDTLASMPHFECGAFNRSATSPKSSDLALSL